MEESGESVLIADIQTAQRTKRLFTVKWQMLMENCSGSMRGNGEVNKRQKKQFM